MYRTIDTAIWIDAKIRALPPDGKLLFVYLITNSHTHVSGIYYLPVVLISHELGIKATRVEELLDTLSIPYRYPIQGQDGVGSDSLISWDRVSELIWVRKMFARQGCGEKNAKAAASHLESLPKSSLIRDFLQFYEDRQIPYRYPIDTLSAQEQEQEQDQKQDQKQKQEQDQDAILAATETPAAQIMLTFPCDGDPSEWYLTDAHCGEWRTLFPHLDVLRECRGALAWIKADSARQKTSRGMKRFLVGWLGRAQDKSRSNGSSQKTFDQLKLDETYRGMADYVEKHAHD